MASIPAGISWSPKHPAFQSLLSRLSEEAGTIYVVGGAVRDACLGRAPEKQTDIDVVVEHSALHVARSVADRLGWAYYPLDSARDVARLVFTAATPPLVCDISAMRGGSIEHDLLARDFTVNAMAIEWRREGAVRLVDPTGGAAHLALRLLQRVNPASLAEDPIRLLRAVRLAQQLDFTIEEETRQQMLRMADTVRLSSPERIRDELWKIMQQPMPQRALAMLAGYGLLRPVLPELADGEGVAQSAPHTLDVLAHTLATVDFADQLRTWLKGDADLATALGAPTWQQALAPWRFRLREHYLQPLTADRLHVDWLVWHALLHDAGKPATRTVEITTGGVQRYRFLEHEAVGATLAAARLEGLRFARHEVDLAQTVVQAHMRPHHLHSAFTGQPLGRRALYRFFRDTGLRQAGLLPGQDVILLALADYQAIYAVTTPPDWPAYVQHAGEMLAFALDRDGIERIRKPLVDGHTIMQYFNLAPGRQVGELLDRLQEAQATGDIATREEALALAATWLPEMRN
jgi:poly(A) polymerase/tRNA nucleotidyltransferase (CCA-adding enzyme)